MTITEWFCRAVAAGLMPEWENVIAYWSGDTANVYNDDTNQYIETGIEVEEFDHVQLRSNNKDLYSLEWRKPTFKNMGEYVWMYNAKNDILQKVVIDHDLLDFEAVCTKNNWQYLLADHGQIAPIKADFIKVYGG